MVVFLGAVWECWPLPLQMTKSPNRMSLRVIAWEVVVLRYISTALSIKDSAPTLSFSRYCPARVLAAKMRICRFDEPTKKVRWLEESPFRTRGCGCCTFNCYPQDSLEAVTEWKWLWEITCRISHRVKGTTDWQCPCKFGSLCIWAPVHLGPCAFRPLCIWVPVHLGPCAFGPPIRPYREFGPLKISQ